MSEVPAKDSVQVRRTNYNRLVRQARLISIILESIEFKIAPQALTIDKSQFEKRALSTNAKILSYEAEKVDGTCIANITWSTLIKLKRKNVVKCKASYLVYYGGMNNCDQEDVQTFVDSVGKSATYAYFRALYAHLDWSANLGSPPLPIVRFQPKL